MRKLRQFTPDEDAQLLFSWHRGDLTAFETLIWKYQKRIFNLTLLLTLDQKAAGEATENAFVTAYHNIKSLKSTHRFSPWLIAIALKECRELDDLQEESSALQAAALTPPEDSSYSAAMNWKLNLCIRALPVELKELILLRYVRGYSLERMEDILQINGDFLLTRLFEAQETLAFWLRSELESSGELTATKTASPAIHPEIRRNLSAYLDNSADPAEKELTKEHLKSCGSCREALAELEWMIEDLKGLPDIEPPQWLATAIMQKIKSAPLEREESKPPSRLRIQLTIALLFIAIIIASAYLLRQKSEPSGELSSDGNPADSSGKPAEKIIAPVSTGITSAIKGVLKGTGIRFDSTRKPESATGPSIPLPAGSAAETQPLQAPPTQALQPAETLKGDIIQRTERSEPAAALPPEWGDAPPQNLPQPKRAVQARSRSSETSALLSCADPVAVAHDIESAVAANGGRVNGRAYSNNRDILYIKIEVDRVIELMSRLGKICKIQELPLLPDGAEGTVELIIRWQPSQ